MAQIEGKSRKWIRRLGIDLDGGHIDPGGDERKRLE
jgi:hypothetical protein